MLALDLIRGKINADGVPVKTMYTDDRVMVAQHNDEVLQEILEEWKELRWSHCNVVLCIDARLSLLLTSRQYAYIVIVHLKQNVLMRMCTHIQQNDEPSNVGSYRCNRM